MCGIIGYVGSQPAMGILLDGLESLTPRGYDSAGIAMLRDSILHRVRSVGPVTELARAIGLRSPELSTIGIGHTRWATHGSVTEENTHPHLDCLKKIAVVHNGVIENDHELRAELWDHGHAFTSETDTELIVHLIEQAVREREIALEEAVTLILPRLRGTYGLAVISVDEPGTIVVARLGSPLLIGVKDDARFIASNVEAFMRHTRQVVYLEDGDVAVLTAESHQVHSKLSRHVSRPSHQVDWDVRAAQKDGYAHFMLKEILEQPQTVKQALRGRINLDTGDAQLGGLRDHQEALRSMRRLVILGCGSSYHAGLIGRIMIETMAGIPVEVDIASEYRYRRLLLDHQTAVLSISQSGETLDTILAQREARQLGALTLGIVNVVGSTLTRENDGGVYSHAGPEVGVASTKAFLSQLCILALFSLFLARRRGMPEQDGMAFVQALCSLGDDVMRCIENVPTANVRALARQYADARGMLVLGRGLHAPLALEGALKIKEVSYIHAEGYPAGEMKHGPLALVDAGFPSIVLCPHGPLFEKTLGTMRELKARGGPILAISDVERMDVEAIADEVLIVPSIHPLLQPIMSIIPLQFLAYEMAIAKGLDPDKPRNLAKSVTVE